MNNRTKAYEKLVEAALLVCGEADEVDELIDVAIQALWDQLTEAEKDEVS